MIVVLDKKVTTEQIAAMAQDYDGYIKFVVDVIKKILAGGGERHVDAEQKLLALGSLQDDLWGGGIDWETKEIDYNSMINLRPSQNNPSRDILSQEIRKQIDSIVSQLFGL